MSYQGGKLILIIKVLIRMIMKEPEITKNLDYLMATLESNVPELKNKKECINCGRSMEHYLVKADILNGVLLKRCAEKVRENIRKGIPFTEANMILVTELDTSNAVIRRASQLKFLNLIQQPKNKQRTGYYVITNWGWKLLGGGEVPKSVTMFNGKIVSRSEDTITLEQMFKQHRLKISEAVARRRKVRNDYRADVSDYDPTEWTEYVGIQKGELF